MNDYCLLSNSLHIYVCPREISEYKSQCSIYFICHPKGNQSRIFIGRSDAEAETPVLWPLLAKSWLIGKGLWCWEGLGAEGEGDDRGWDGWMASWTQCTWFWGPGSLACCSPWSRKIVRQDQVTEKQQQEIAFVLRWIGN